jgi:hypothetical protein
MSYRDATYRIAPGLGWFDVGETGVDRMLQPHVPDIRAILRLCSVHAVRDETEEALRVTWIASTHPLADQPSNPRQRQVAFGLHQLRHDGGAIAAWHGGCVLARPVANTQRLVIDLHEGVQKPWAVRAEADHDARESRPARHHTPLRG